MVFPTFKYLHSDFNRSASFNVSELSHKKATYTGNLTYEAVCLHISLEVLEQLLQSAFDVSSPEHEAFLLGLDRPFRVAARYTAPQSLEITHPSLTMIEDTPALLLVIGGTAIVIISLSNGQVGVQFECNHSQFYPLAVRILLISNFLVTNSHSIAA